MTRWRRSNSFFGMDKALGARQEDIKRREEECVEACARIVARLLTNILGADGITADSNFFRVGGDSLAAVSLAAAVEMEFGVKLDSVDVFERPDLRDYASLIVS